MDIRGERECARCGTRWSYYETGEVACPDCGSLRSVGTDERTTHTASPAELDLSGPLGALGEEPLRRVASEAAETCGAYRRKQGFVHAGELRDLAETYLLASELEHVGRELGRRMRHDDEEERYLLALLEAAGEGERPPPESVPDSLRPSRGLAVADAVEDYLRELRAFTASASTAAASDPEAPLAGVLSRVRDHAKRIQALDGDVDPARAEAVVRAVRDAGRYVREDDEAAIATARERLDSISSLE